jgi:hypothetical protein
VKLTGGRAQGRVLEYSLEGLANRRTGARERTSTHAKRASIVAYLSTSRHCISASGSGRSCTHLFVPKAVLHG